MRILRSEAQLRIEVHVEKTVVMVYQKGKRPARQELMAGDVFDFQFRSDIPLSDAWELVST